MTHAAIRPATEDDLERMIAVEVAAADLFPLDVLPADVGRSGARDDTQRAIRASLAWVAEAEGDGVVGFLTAQIAGHCLHVAEMDVLPSHGRRGIGGQLLAHACTHARHHGLRALTLTTFAHVPWNAPFYAKHGFSIVNEPQELEHLRAALAHERSCGLKDRVAMMRAV